MKVKETMNVNQFKEVAPNFKEIHLEKKDVSYGSFKSPNFKIISDYIILCHDVSSKWR